MNLRTFSLPRSKTIPTLLAALVLAATYLGASTAFAGGGTWVHGRYWPDAKARKPVHHPFETIESVDVAGGKIVVAHHRGTDHSQETLKVNRATEIMINSQRSDLSALKKGMRVDITHGTDVSEASRIVVGNG